MKNTARWLTLLVLLAFVLAACGAKPTAKNETMEKAFAAEEVMMEKETPQPMDEKSDLMMDQTPTVEMMEENSAEVMMVQTPTSEMMNKNEGESHSQDASSAEMMTEDKSMGMSDQPAWFQTALIDARSGEQFTLGDFQGKVVLVETLAMWCSNCLKQQKEVKALHELLGERMDFVSLGLDIDPNENIQDLKAYIERNSFGWTYAVAPEELALGIRDQFGGQFLNPPSTPMFVIDRQGGLHPLPFGIKSAADLQQALQPFLSE